jgi:hypothetical protein
MKQNQQKQHSSNDLMRYAGLGGQIFAALGIAVFAGYKVDGWLHTSIPLLVWLLPLAVLSMMIYSMIKDTSKHKREHEKK